MFLKARLNQSEADALESIVSNNGASHACQLFVTQENTRVKWTGECEALNNFSADTFFRAVYIGYEIIKPPKPKNKSSIGIFLYGDLVEEYEKGYEQQALDQMQFLYEDTGVLHELRYFEDGPITVTELK